MISFKILSPYVNDGKACKLLATIENNSCLLSVTWGIIGIGMMGVGFWLKALSLKVRSFFLAPLLDQ